MNAPEAGTIAEFFVSEEDTVTVGQDLLKLELGSAPEGGASKPPAETAGEEAKAPADAGEGASKKTDESPQQPAPKEEPKPAPKKEEGPKEAPKPASAPASASSKAPSSGWPMGNRTEQRVKMTRMRLRIAERLKESQNTAASLTTFNEIDMSAVMEMRKLYKDAVMEKTGVKLGFMGPFSRAVVEAMKDVPAVNAGIEGPKGGDTIVYRDYVDISVAVATAKGLVTPIVRNAETLDVIGIERAIAELGAKARENKLTIEDMAGGTFTISNGGVFG